MKLKLIDFNKFITKEGIKEVRTVKHESKSGKPDAEGLFSEEIFGRIGSPQRRAKFGYIDLKLSVIHPEIWDVVIGINPIFNKIIAEKNTYILDPDGNLIEDPTGETGMNFFITNFDKFNLKKLGKNRKEYVNFITKNKDLVFIDNILVLPAGVRDIQYSKTTGKTRVVSAEINDLYGELISNTKTIPENITMLPDEIISSMITAIQRKVIEINEWIRKRLKGKAGLIRHGMLRKFVDYSGRLIIAGDPSLKLGFIGVPWQVCLKLYEPFVEYKLLKSSFNIQVLELIRDFMKKPDVDSNEIKKFLTKINDQPDAVPKLLKDELIRIAEEIVKDKVVIFKRDPVENRDSIVSAYIRVDKEGHIMRINPLECKRNGADFDGDTMAIYPLFTKKANEEAKTKMHPRHSKAMWVAPHAYNHCPYVITLDAATAIYTATKI